MTGAIQSPQNKICGYEYTVRRGDSFYLIAHRLGVPLRDLLEANSTINPARLMVGDVLCIPMEEDDAVQEPAQEPTPTPSAPTEEPETPSAEQEETPEPAQQTPQVVEVPEEAPSEIILEVEPADLLDHPATEPTTPSGSTSTNETIACPDGDCYTVAAGETVTDIQLERDLTLNAIRQANPEVDVTALQGGEVLCLPKTDAPTVSSTYTLRAEDTLESLALELDVSVGALLRSNPCLAPSGFREGTVICLPAQSRQS